MIDWKKWAYATFIRCIRTFAEAMLAYIGGDAVAVGKFILSDINWLAALSAGAFGAIIAVLFAMISLPEVEKKPVQIEPPDEE